MTNYIIRFSLEDGSEFNAVVKSSDILPTLVQLTDSVVLKNHLLPILLGEIEGVEKAEILSSHSSREAAEAAGQKGGLL